MSNLIPGRWASADDPHTVRSRKPSEEPMQEIKPGADEAAECWVTSVQPLVDLYGSATINLIHAIVISYRARFPVPIYITGTSRSGADDLLEATAALTGDWPILRSQPITLPTIRLAAQRAQPLLIENAAPGKDIAGPNMFELISDESLDYGTPLEEVTILIASGGRRLGRELRHRTLHIPLPAAGPTRVQRKVTTSVTADSARRLVAIYLQQNVPTTTLPARTQRELTLAADSTQTPHVRCDAALSAAPALISALQLPILRAPEDPILEATRAAIRRALSTGQRSVTRTGHELYVIPEQILPAIRQAAHDENIKHYDVARALEVARALNTQTREQATQGSTTPVRLDNRLQRVWKVRDTLL